jgi:hypothetical protein
LNNNHETPGLFARADDDTLIEFTPEKLFLQDGTNAKPRTYLSKLKDVVSVKDFGAKGDGIADDTAAVHSARDAVGTGVLYFPAGTYKGNFVFGKGVCVKGAGKNKTIFKAQSPASPIIWLTDANTSTYFYTSGERFTVDGEGTAAVGIEVGTGASLGTVTYGALKDVFVDNCVDNIYIKDAVGFNIDGVRSYRASATCLKILSSNIVTVLNVENSQFTLSGDTGVHLEDGAIVNFESCVIESNANIGLFVFRSTSSGARQLTFSNCWFEDNARSPTTSAASGVYIDLPPAHPEYPSYLTFNNCGHSSHGSSKSVHIQRGRATFNKCSFDAFTAAKLYAEPGNSAAYGFLNDCGTILDKPSPTLYANLPAVTRLRGGANLVGFFYRYDFQGHIYTNQRNPAFSWYIVTAPAGIASTGAGLDYTTAMLSGSSGNDLLFDTAGNFAAGAFTAPQSGEYEFDAVWPITNFSTDMADVEVAFIRNPSGASARFVAYKEKIAGFSINDLKTYCGRRQLNLSAGDTVVATIKISGSVGNTAQVLRNATLPGLFSFSGKMLA